MSAPLLPPRDAIPEEETWRLSDIFATPAAWEAEVARLAIDLDALTRYQGRLGEGAHILLECLETQEKLAERLGRVSAYAHLSLATDGGSAEAQAANARTQPLQAKMATFAAAIRSELLQLPAGTVERYREEQPGLAVFARMLNQISADRHHALTPEAERVIATYGEVLNAPGALYGRTTTADMRFPPAYDSQGRAVPVTLGDFIMHIEHSPDNALRRSAWDSLTRGLAPYQHTLAANLGSLIRRNVLTARLRGYPSAIAMMIESAWVPGGPFGVSEENFNTVLDVLQAEYAPHARRYAQLRKRVLGLDRMLMCDVQARPDIHSPELSYAQGAEWIEASVAVMGEEYRQIIHDALHDRWIDRAVNAGRVGGAFAAPVYGVHPYVFSSWSGGLRALFVLAHELGHAAHEALSCRYQRLPNIMSNIYSVEAPSTFGEMLLARHLLRTSSDPQVRVGVLASLLGTYHHNFITHLLEAELLRRLYRLAEQDRPITAKVLGDETADLLRHFWGDEVELDEGARLTWMRQSHYYHGLYPYTYAVGLAGSTVAAQRLDAEGPRFAEKWVAMLKAGYTQGPVEQFQMVDVPLDSPATLRAAIAYAGGLVTELERLLG